MFKVWHIVSQIHYGNPVKDSKEMCKVADNMVWWHVKSNLPYPKPVYAGPVYTEMPLECHWLTQCTLGHHWVTRRILAGYTGTPLEKLTWNCPILECQWRNSDYCGLHWNTTGRNYNPPPPPPPPTHTHTHTHTEAHIVKQIRRVASRSVWNDKLVGHQAASGQVSVNSAFIWNSLLCNA